MQTDSPIESYTIVCKNRSFGRIVRFSYETVQDAKAVSNILQETVGTWGQKLPVTKEKFYAKFFNHGCDTSGHDVFNNTITGVVDDSSANLIYDSQPFFDGAHANRVGGSYDNYSGTNALTHSNLKSTYLKYTTTNNRDERGDIVDITPDTLLIPPALRFTAQEILNSTLIPGSMDNDKNVLENILTPLEWAYLTDDDGWFLCKAKMGIMATDRKLKLATLTGNSYCKSGELLEALTYNDDGNQQPSLGSNSFEGSETNFDPHQVKLGEIIKHECPTQISR